MLTVLRLVLGAWACLFGWHRFVEFDVIERSLGREVRRSARECVRCRCLQWKPYRNAEFTEYFGAELERFKEPT